MSTTVGALSAPTQQVHHRGLVALGVAAILAIGGVAAGIAVADNNNSGPALSHTPFVEQPMLTVGGPR